MFVSVRLLTEILDPSVYGELALGLTVATLVNQVVFGPIGHGVTRYFAPAAEHDDLGNYFSAVKCLVSRASLLLALFATVVVVGLAAFGEPQSASLGAASAVFAGLVGIGSIVSGIQSAARQRAVVALHQGADPWLRFLGAAALIVWLGAGSVVALFGYAVAALIMLLSQCRYLGSFARCSATDPGESAGWLDQMWKFAWPMSVFGIFTWLQLVSDRWALEHFSTMQEVGMYAALFQIGFYPISLANGMVMQLIVPIVYQRAGDAKNRARNNYVKQLNWWVAMATLGATALAFVVTQAFHTEVFGFFVAAKYMAVSSLLPWMLLAGGIQAAAQTIALNLMTQMATRRMMVVKISTALAGIALNFIGAYQYGTLGVVVAANLFALLLFACMVLTSRGMINNVSV